MEQLIGNPSVIKRLNKDVVEKVIRDEGPITKPAIAKRTDLSLVTVNKLVENLQKENKVKPSAIEQSTGGRRAQSYVINEEFNYNVVLYFERDMYVGVVANSIGDIVYEEEFRLPDVKKSVLEDIYRIIDVLLEKCEEHEVTAIGLGIPGVVNDGVVTSIPQIPCLEGMDVEKTLTKRYQIRVVLENDINLAARGIYCSEYKEEVDNLAVIYLEEGIGSGIIINQELFKGSSNFAGELSYLPMEESSQRVTFEERVSVIYEKLDSTQGEEWNNWKKVFCKTIRDSLISIVCILNPEIVVLKCEHLAKEDVKLLDEMLQEYVGEENAPKLIKAQDLKRYSIDGIINMCIEESKAMYLLSNGK
ncbi:MAG: ROK family protein [Lachnospiraceae bacterium]|nr:ROK family protein [Lachnospiraceae bacterium]